ncbi:MAG: thiamine pyrophosphate-dependent enzyme, partial [Sphingomonadales bacterium]
MAQTPKAQPKSQSSPRKPSKAKSGGTTSSRSADIARRRHPKVPAIHKAGKEELVEFYRTMLLMRRFEEKAGQMYGMGLIGGFCHLYIGQEAVVTGIQSALKEGDKVITGYRDHAHMLACEIDSKAVMAELTGRAAGISKGK